MLMSQDFDFDDIVQLIKDRYPNATEDWSVDDCKSAIIGQCWSMPPSATEDWTL